MGFLPYAILPSTQETDFDDNTTTTHRSVLNVLENKRYEWNNMFKGHADAWCVGSSHDWLILLDNKGCPLLLNPSFASCIYLPPFSPAFIRRASVPSYSHYVQSLRETFVSKAVLISSPSPSQYTLAVLYAYPCKIAFCKQNATWAELELFDAMRYYCDIVFNNHNLYALTEDGSVEGWDFSQKVPRKILDVIRPTSEIDEEEEKEFPRDKFSTKLYLVISDGEFLLVERYIGNFVNADGEVVYEGDSLSYEGEICPYRTKHFIVFKLDLVKNTWEKMKSLGDKVLFLGVNESSSVAAAASGCEPNSIYFTDDRWEEMNMDYSYGGHDWGVFSLHDRSVKLFAPYADKMNPPPIWVVGSN